jgi:hypothetical protein
MHIVRSSPNGVQILPHSRQRCRVETGAGSARQSFVGSIGSMIFVPVRQIGSVGMRAAWLPPCHQRLCSGARRGSRGSTGNNRWALAVDAVIVPGVHGELRMRCPLHCPCRDGSTFDAGPRMPGLERLIRHFSPVSEARAAHLAEKPAKFFGLWPEERRHTGGADADLVVLKPFKFVRDSAHAHNGQLEFSVRVAKTFLRGRLLWDGKTFWGRALWRLVPGPARAPRLASISWLDGT